MILPTANGRHSQPLIPAVGYLRKSTKGKKADGKVRQEKSISQQKEEIIKLAAGRYAILKWFEDEGISGWKRGAARPDFHRMLNQVKDLGAQAILCDHLDRFSRATIDDVQEDASQLRKAGVRRIITASHGEYDLQAGQRNDIGGMIAFVAAVWGAHEYSRNLGRRLALARRNKALEAKRTGGPAPYGLENDGMGGLKHGDARHIKVVRWIFDQFTNQLRSISWIAGDLNQRKVPGPSTRHDIPGGRWYVKTVGGILRQPAYRGDFRFNRVHEGQFFGIDDKGEVVDSSELNGKGKVFVTEGIYKPVIDPALFDKAQRRMETIANNRGRRKRMGYALTGILVCDHCGGKMHALRSVRRRKDRKQHKEEISPTIYRCSARFQFGRSACGVRQVREDKVLPLVMRMLGQEIKDLQAMLTVPPDELSQPNRERTEHRRQLDREREQLVKRIAKAVENIMEVEDKRTRQEIDRQLTAMRDNLERIDAELNANGHQGEAYTRDDLQALNEWWDKFAAEAVSVPVPADANLGMAGGLMQDPESEESAILIEPRKVNEALHMLGAEVRLRWETKQWTGRRSGKVYNQHVVVRGRFRLGQHAGILPVQNPAGDSEPAACGRVQKGARTLGSDSDPADCGRVGKGARGLFPRELLATVDRVFDGAELAG